jgi:hypothetical protein
MEIIGKVTQLLAEQSGEGKNGRWRKREYVIETGDQYPKKICFNLWGDKIDQFPMKEGDNVTVSFDLESREFNGKWYTDVKAWKVENGAKKGNSNQPTNESFSAPDDAPEYSAPPITEDDLPF